MELVQRLVLRKGVKSMKKQYVKPELYFESFELSTSIATCDVISNHIDNACPVTDKELGVTCFAENQTGCYRTPGPNDKKVCYQPPAPGSVVFSS